jgi:hypothetical protein
MPIQHHTKPIGPKFVDLEGKQFGRWTVIGYAGKSAANMSLWACRCKCGNESPVLAKHLLSGMSQSCGCLRDELLSARQKAKSEERARTRDPFAKPDSPLFVDLTGHTYGEWFVVQFAEKTSSGSCSWLCRCSCGTERPVKGSNLRSGTSRSCRSPAHEYRGNKTHGDSKERLYWIYRGILQRCNDPRNEDYGGRGITICDEWRSSYIAFREWALSHGYRDDLTIERKDVNGNYTPENCEWIPHPDQQANKRTTVHLTAFGETKHLSAWTRDPRCIVPEYTLRRRVDAGWDDELAIGTPQRTVHCLEEADIPRVREMIAEGRTLQEIADEFDVGVSTIMDIKAGRAWASV